MAVHHPHKHPGKDVSHKEMESHLEKGKNKDLEKKPEGDDLMKMPAEIKRIHNTSY